MADLGSIGTLGEAARLGTYPQAKPLFWRSIHVNGEYQARGGRDNVEGNPFQPSLRIEMRGRFRFRWVLAVGARTISINVKQAVNLSPRPSLVVKANPETGIMADVETFAASGTGWVTIGPVAISPSAQGALWVELRSNYDGQSGIPCYWDDLRTT